MSERAIVVGGGVIGAAIAHELLSRHIQCTVFDKGNFFGEASTAAAGMLCPSAEIFDGVEYPEIFQASGERYPYWVAELEEESGISVHHRSEGMFRMIMSSAQAQIAKHRVDHQRSQWIPADDVRQAVPGLSPTVSGAIFFPKDAQVHPVHLGRALKKALMKKGCRIKEGVTVHSLLSKSGRVTGVMSSEGPCEADIVVVAAGAWSQTLLATVGAEVPIIPVKGEMLAVRALDVSLPSMIQGPQGMVLPRQDGTFSLGVTMEQVGYDKRRTVKAMTSIFEKVIDWYPALAHAEFATSWAGLRPMSADRNPVIGPIAGIDNLFVATGHYSVGILLAPVTATLIGEMIFQRETLAVSDARMLAPSRFS